MRIKYYRVVDDVDGDYLIEWTEDPSKSTGWRYYKVDIRDGWGGFVGYTWYSRFKWRAVWKLNRLVRRQAYNLKEASRKANFVKKVYYGPKP